MYRRNPNLKRFAKGFDSGSLLRENTPSSSSLHRDNDLLVVGDADAEMIANLLARVRASDGNARHRKRWSAAVWRARCGVAASSSYGALIDVANPTFARLHGYSVEELVGRPITDLICHDRIDYTADQFVIAEKTGRHAFRSAHLGRHGERIPVLLRVNVVWRQDGAACERIIVVHRLDGAKLSPWRKEKMEFASSPPSILALAG